MCWTEPQMLWKSAISAAEVRLDARRKERSGQQDVDEARNPDDGSTANPRFEPGEAGGVPADSSQGPLLTLATGERHKGMRGAENVGVHPRRPKPFLRVRSCATRCPDNPAKINPC